MREVSCARAGALGKPDLGCDGARLIEQVCFRAHRPPEGEARAAARLDRKRKVVEHAEALEDAGDLVAAGESALHALVRAQARHILVEEPDLAALGGQASRDLTDERGLARAVGPDQRMHLAGLHLEAHAVGGNDAAEALRHALKLEHEIFSRAGRRCPAGQRAR
jgi:hypothetical protein